LLWDFFHGIFSWSDHADTRVCAGIITVATSDVHSFVNNLKNFSSYSPGSQYISHAPNGFAVVGEAATGQAGNMPYAAADCGSARIDAPEVIASAADLGIFIALLPVSDVLLLIFWGCAGLRQDCFLNYMQLTWNVSNNDLHKPVIHH
jgi:hypothetical protein